MYGREKKAKVGASARTHTQRDDDDRGNLQITLSLGRPRALSLSRSSGVCVLSTPPFSSISYLLPPLFSFFFPPPKRGYGNEAGRAAPGCYYYIAYIKLDKLIIVIREPRGNTHLAAYRDS